jgi:hypothetical protein
VTLQTLAALPDDVVRELAIAQGVCIRPLLRRVMDREADTETTVAIACGSTREAVCPPCARKARVLRMQQCAEGWHRTDEPERICQDVRSAGPSAHPPSVGPGPPATAPTSTSCRGCRLTIARWPGCSPLPMAANIGRVCL